MLPHTLLALDRRGASGAAELVACAVAASERAELDHVQPRPDRDELRALYAAAY